MLKVNFDQFFQKQDVLNALEEKDLNEVYDLFFDYLEDCFDDNFDSKDMCLLTIELYKKGIDVLSLLTNEIPQGAFAYCNIDEIEIPDHITAIGNDAFAYCDDARSIILPAGLKKVAYDAFEHHPADEDCVPRKVIFKGTLQDWCAIKFERYWSNPVDRVFCMDELYIDGERIESELIIPEGVEVVESNTFRGFDQISKIVFPNTLKRIEEMAFYDCSNIEEIVVPDSVEYIGMCAFEGCRNLKKVIFGKESKLKKIDKNAFYDCLNIKEIVFPRNLETIDKCAFQQCTSLEKVSQEKDGVLTEIEDHVFAECKSLRTITLPGSLRFLGKEVFDGCDTLKEVYYEGTLRQWCKIRFDDCVYYMTNPLCEAEKLYIDSQLVEGELTLPNDCTSISEIAFAGQKRITSVTIPNSVKTIGQNAFANCDNLTDVYYQGTKEQWGEIWIGLGCDFFVCLAECETDLFPNATINFGDQSPMQDK